MRSLSLLNDTIMKRYNLCSHKIKLRQIFIESYIEKEANLEQQQRLGFDTRRNNMERDE